MTPYEIGVMLHYYVSATDHEDAERNPPIWRPTIQRFLDDGLLKFVAPDERDQRYPTTYAITDRGRVYCYSLQLVELPVAVWGTPPMSARYDWPTASAQESPKP
jgi:hypothetical protein